MLKLILKYTEDYAFVLFCSQKMAELDIDDQPANEIVIKRIEFVEFGDGDEELEIEVREPPDNEYVFVCGTRSLGILGGNKHL